MQEEQDVLNQELARPVTLVVAGSDSSGGAGLQADGKTLQALGVYALQVVTAVTAQNPGRVLRVQGLGAEMVRDQMEAVLAAYTPRSVKTGMLWDRDTVLALAEGLERMASGIPLVVDPVMIATSGHPLLDPAAIAACRDKLFPMATLVTPNVPEAEWLSGRTVRTPGDQDEVAVALSRNWNCAVLLKGGHLQGEIRDVLAHAGGGLRL